MQSGGDFIRKTCVIFDVDEVYSYRLMNYLKSVSAIPYELLVFTERKALLEYFAKDEAEVLITNDDTVLELASKWKVSKILKLSEEQTAMAVCESTEYHPIFKYQSTDNIVKEVVHYCLEQPQYLTNSKRSKSKGRIVGIYSPAGRCYKTTFALALSNALSKKGSVLYVNLEEYSGLTESILARDKGSLSEIMYMYRRGYSGIGARIQSVIGRIGKFDYLPPVEYPEDVVDVLPEEWITFIEFLFENMDYDYLVVDIGNLVKKAWNFFEVMDVVFIPQTEDGMSVNKLREFVTVIANMGRGFLMENAVYVQIPEVQELAGKELSMEKIEWSAVGSFARKVVDERGL